MNSILYPIKIWSHLPRTSLILRSNLGAAFFYSTNSSSKSQPNIDQLPSSSQLKEKVIVTPGATPQKLAESPAVFGVPEPPNIDHEGWISKAANKAKGLNSYEKVLDNNIATRRMLVEKISTSYWKDVNELGVHGGKMWHAHNRLIKADKALYMPNFWGTNLNNQNVDTTNIISGKTSLMSFVYSKSGEPHVESFVTPFRKEFEGVKGIEVVEMNVQENILKSFILKAFVPAIRRNVLPQRQANYILYYKNIELLRRPLWMNNLYIGYVFLIDNDCKIRWAAHGIASPTEIDTMVTLTKSLHKRNLNK